MIIDIMRTRRSIRRFKTDPIPEEILIQLIEAAITAPSAGNKQPWRFLVVDDREAIASAAGIVDEKRHALKTVLVPEFQAEFETYSEHFSIFRTAPALILPLFRVFTGVSGMLGAKTPQKYHDLSRSLERHTSVVSVSLAIQNMLLIAEEKGIGACCMTGPLIAKEDLEKHLQVPEGWEIAAVIAVGFPDEKPVPPGRKHLSSIIRWYAKKQ